jgi:hypothetical protein
MKKILTLVFAFGLSTAFGQTPINNTNEVVPKLNEPLKKEPSVEVYVIIGPFPKAPKTAFFLNGQFIKLNLLVSTDPGVIDSANVSYKPIEIDSVKYARQIHFIAKNNYFPKAISLTKLKEKYFPGRAKNEPMVVTIDGNIAHGDYDTYKIDENNLYAVGLDIQNTTDKIQFRLLKLTTRSEANIKNFKSGGIWMQKGDVLLTR